VKKQSRLDECSSTIHDSRADPIVHQVRNGSYVEVEEQASPHGTKGSGVEP